MKYCETYGSLIICMHASTRAETLVKIGSLVVEIFGDIGQFRPSRSTIFIFYPTLTQQVALLWQRDHATRLSVEILQLQNIHIVWHYLRDSTFSGFYRARLC